MTIVICELCWSKYDDTKYDSCIQCSGKTFESMDGEKIVFDNADQMRIVANAAEDEASNAEKLMLNQADRVFIEQKKYDDLNDSRTGFYDDSEKLRKNISNIKHQKEYNIVEAKRIEDEKELEDDKDIGEVPIPRL